MSAAALLALSGIGHADIYVFTDPQGVRHFSNVPTDDRYSILAPGPEAENEGLSGAVRYQSLIEEAARKYNLEQALLHAVILAESGYNPKALSPRGAAGLMQLMPETAKRFGVSDPFDPAQNILAGARYLRHLLSRFNDDLELALAAYNAGEGAIARHGNRIPPYPETQIYVPKVLNAYKKNKSRQ